MLRGTEATSKHGRIEEEFYVGYLPTTRGLRRFLQVNVGIAVLMAVGIGIVLAAWQRDPGEGQWRPEQVEEITGLLLAEPYPSLLVASTSDGQRRLLLVGEGKTRIDSGALTLAGKPVTVRGSILRRGNLELFEAISVSQSTSVAWTTEPAAASAYSNKALRGEIVDPKCYAGAMKPGDGKTHKACATLCIRGGVPPVLMGDDGSAYVLVDERGKALNGASLDVLLPYVGDRVEVSGAVEEAGAWSWMRIDLKSVRRI